MISRVASRNRISSCQTEESPEFPATPAAFGYIGACTVMVTLLGRGKEVPSRNTRHVPANDFLSDFGVANEVRESLQSYNECRRT